MVRPSRVIVGRKYHESLTLLPNRKKIRQRGAVNEKNQGLEHLFKKCMYRIQNRTDPLFDINYSLKNTFKFAKKKCIQNIYI